MKWKSNYTGIDVCEMGDRFQLYLQRNSGSKKLIFARVSVKRLMLGIHIGRQNYGSCFVRGGFQLFTNSFAFGIGRSYKSKKQKLVTVIHSGSRIRPFANTVMILVNHIVIAWNTPRFMQVRLEKKREEELDDIFSQY